MQTRKALSLIACLIFGALIGAIIYKTITPAPIDTSGADIAIAKIETERDQIARELIKVNEDLQRTKAELDKKPKERIIIKKVYETKRDSVFALPFDERLQLFANRLSEIDTLGGR